DCFVVVVQRRQVRPLLDVRISIRCQLHQRMGSSILRNTPLQTADNLAAIRRRQLDWKNVRNGTVFVSAACEGIATTHHQVTATAVADEVDDILKLVLRKEGGLDAAKDQTLERKQFLFFLRKALRQHLFFVDALAIELVLRGTE